MSPSRQNTFRIIGGVHRGRRFAFPADESIRPSPDRVRETVFNWLQPVVAGARCLDLYAGSGAFGIEALSRGAAQAEFVDRSPRSMTAIREHLGALKEGGKARFHVADVAVFLGAEPRPFDVVFVDPPYAAGLLPVTLQRLAAGWLAPGAHIYIECAARDGIPALPKGWAMQREKRAGEVGFFLATSE